MNQHFRSASGGLVDRSQPLAFTFDGVSREGCVGDTLASALLANGVHFVARSNKYHRPRGILAMGAEEPNALLQLGRKGLTEPNLRATQVALYNLLRARSVNVYPSRAFDLGAAISGFSPLLAAGFHHKTFIRSRWMWRRLWEPMIRRCAGWGWAADAVDLNFYEHRHEHCDVLVIGGGPVGLASALAASGSGARVILADEQERLGGSLLTQAAEIDGVSGVDWARRGVHALGALGQVRVLPRTTVFGAYDDNYYCAVERMTDHLPQAARRRSARQRLWHVRAKQVLLATGAHERPLVFAGNDRPGIMLAGAVEGYLRRWAVRSGNRMVLFTNNDRAYSSVFAAHDAGIDIAAVIDSRESVPESLRAALDARGIPLAPGHVVDGTTGRTRVRRIRVRRRDDASGARFIECDVLAVSGGLSPAVQLFCQTGGRLIYDETSVCLRPHAACCGPRPIGACNGVFDLAAAVDEGVRAGADAARKAGYAVSTMPSPDVRAPEYPGIEPLWSVPPTGRHRGPAFVDYQTDTTVDDLRLAAREGFESIEQIARYTSIGVGTDQGKTSIVNALGILSGLLDRPIGALGTVAFRPPYTPVTFGTIAGRHRGTLFDPERVTPMHDWHVAHGVRFEDVGQWKRPWYYPRDGEDRRAAVARESVAARTRVAVLDASTLGKIDIQGADAAEFLNRVYTNGCWSTLAPGRVRYGLMCDEDGIVFDDGVTARVGEHRYLMTTTTGGAERVLAHLERHLETEWPQLRVRLTPVTEQWSTVSIAGPRSRDVLAKLASQVDWSAQGFAAFSWQDHVLAGLPARILRVNLTGALQYNVLVPWHVGQALWNAVIEAGQAFDIMPCGAEAMRMLRAEKGGITIGQDTDGAQTPDDLGLGHLVSPDHEFIGRRALSRPEGTRAGRRQLVALLPGDRQANVPEGAPLVEPGTARRRPPVPTLGAITSSYWSPALQRAFCLALLENGRARHGQRVDIALQAGALSATVCDPNLYDPEGARRDG